jgi:hypothetical protein
MYMKKIFPAILLSLALGACTKNLLNTVPATSISESVAYSTSTKILADVNSLYSELETGYYYGGNFIVFMEQRGDEFSQNDGNNSTGANVWNQSITASGNFVNDVWTDAYAAINSANLLIANIANTTVISDSLQTNYVAEAKFIRAFNYFTLVTTYASPYAQDSTAPALPLRLTPSTSSGNDNFPFSTVAAVYAQVIQDLNDAEAGLPAGYSTALLTASRAHQATAIALKTRVYLAQGNYAAVIAEASKLVPATAPYQYSSGTATHRLEANIATVFGGSYTGPEAIFFLPFATAAETPGNQNALAYNYLYPIIYLNTAGIVSDPVFSSTSTDARNSLVITNTVGQRELNKFSHNSVPYDDYVPVIRYAEVLLNYAEAAARTNNPATAVSLLNAVRQRSSPGYVFSPDSLVPNSTLIPTILNERRIELLGEGFRTPDLLRLVQPLPAKTGTAGTAPEVLPTDGNYVWPVPSGESAYNADAPQ